MTDIPEGLTDNPTIPSIIKLIGEELAGQLSWDLGGKQIYIPANPGKNSPLAVSVGLAEAQKIGQVYGGMYLVVPVSSGKRAEALAMLKAGMDVTTIVRKLRCSRSFVYKIRYNIEKENQLSLFSCDQS